jgi:penicillin-binding protein 1C
MRSPFNKLSSYLKYGGIGLGLMLALVAIKTYQDVKTPSLAIRNMVTPGERFAVLDRQGEPLGISFQTRFNMMDVQPLHQIPDILRKAFISAEDRRFFQHNGIDWSARLAALWQDMRIGRKARGASTISEQVVRIVNPRPRTLWSRWLEGFEAMQLEQKYSKGEILEFYLNQVPYAANRRGIAQAARYYFNRDLHTLTEKEMLALAVLPRAPSALDLYQNPAAIEPALNRLAEAMEKRGELPVGEAKNLVPQNLALEPPNQPPAATHFVNFIRETVPYRLSNNGVLLTTLDAPLQIKAQTLLDERVKSLQRKRVHNGAVLVVDHTTGEILVWAVAGAADAKNQTPGSAIDAVRSPRQPGSSMKPFLYTLALEKGWSPATELDDAPMTEAIGTGLHDFHNYSHTFYGKISLREALGNSLNIPALETIAFVTPQNYLDKLHELGFKSLTQSAEFYKDGLALGNGEVTLFEMVQGFSTLANHGLSRPLTPLPHAPYKREMRQVFSEPATSLIGNILSDPYARRREFGAGSVLNLPTQTAVKTGTSTDYRDAWVLGYDAHYTVGVWLGNLDQEPMDGVTGSTGPALVLRSIFSELESREQPQPLYLSPKLVQMEICSTYGNRSRNCFPRTEYFMPGTEAPRERQQSIASGIDLLRPTEGLQIAYDPRIPKEVQAFEFVASGILKNSMVEWVLNGKSISKTPDGRLIWPVERGAYTLLAQEMSISDAIVSTKTVHFKVK